MGPLEWLQNEVLTIPLIIIAITWKGMPGSMLMYYATLQGVNRDLYEAATLTAQVFSDVCGR